ncbi:MAG: hypothetical protein O3B41_05525 [Bacteroidetes bacterium]|nr:hypothetical protein [Bacteroidota bacterium]
MKSLLQRSLLALAIVFALGILGCDSSGDSNSEPDYSGNYILKSVDGESVPVVVFQIGSDKVEVTGGSYRLNSDKTISQSLTFKVTESGVVTTETASRAGTYSNNNSAFLFTYSDNTTDSGSISGDNLTIISDGVSFVFKK